MTTICRHLLFALGFVLAAGSTASASNRMIGEFKPSLPASVSSIDSPAAEANTNIIAAVETAIVLSTGDGDTLQVNQAGQAITLRLGCIDSPETDQPGGQAAADRLRQLLPRDQPIQLIPIDVDRYGRTVAVVFMEGRSVNLQLVKEGQAVVYSQYLSGCPNSRDQLLAAESEARSARLGIWAQVNPVMPWEWRQGTRTSPPLGGSFSFPTDEEPSNTSGLPACVNSDCDCKDFRTQAEAQQVFDAFAGDPFRLDGDRDGRVCEALP